MAEVDHESRRHAKLSASGAHRWMACPGSVAAEAPFPESTSEFAEEGTRAHELAEKYLAGGRPRCSDKEMVGYVKDYVKYVKSLPGDLFIEQRVAFSRWAPGGFGTADAVAIDADAKTLTVVDLKYGKGVPVYAEDNPQGMCYALGALYEFGALYDIETIKIVIHQPRLDNVSEWTLPAQNLLVWAEAVLATAAKAALSDDAQRVPGEKQCRFCKAKGTCKALAEMSLSTAVEGFDGIGGDMPLKVIGDLTPAEVSVLLSQVGGLKSWLTALEAVAYKLAEKSELSGWKLVRGRADRKWVDDGEAIIDALGYSTARTQKLISPKQAEDIIGKDHPIISDYVITPEGKPTLAPESDKRPALDLNPMSGFTENDQS